MQHVVKSTGFCQAARLGQRKGRVGVGGSLPDLHSLPEQDHSENSIGVAATMAHEMGHNFGMTHDLKGCCHASAADGGCIMAAATG